MAKDKQFDNTNRWSLFRNVDKKSETSPDFSGEVNIDGITYKLNGWIKEGKKQRFFSGTVRSATTTPPDAKTIDPDVPF